MKTTGRYHCSCKNDYDVDHEINKQCENIKEFIAEIDTNECNKNKDLIIKAVINTLLDEIVS